MQSRKSRNTRSNRQVWPKVHNEAVQRLTEVCQGNALVIANTLFQQHRRRLYTWTSPDGQHQNQTGYILCSQRWRSSIQSAKVWNAVLGCNLKNDRMISVHFQVKPFNTTLIQVYAPASNVEDTKIQWFYEDLQDFLEWTHTKKSFSL